MKYSKYDPSKKRRETWFETIERNKNMHLSKFPQCGAEIEKAYELVLAKKILPSMRSMQFGGPAVEQNNARIYNCSAIGLDSLDSFADLFYLLLCGTGVGFSVRHSFIGKLPPMKPKSGRKTIFAPEDSIEGWADCIRAITKAYFETGDDLEFDFSPIRPKGALIHSSMCAAPGPGPLSVTCENIKKMLDKKIAANDFMLTSIDCYDICCFISEAVLSGGVRRSAMICLFDKDDELMLHAKEGEWWKDNPQRGLANNSVQFDRATTTKEEFDAIFKQTEASGCGEPGVVWTNNPEWLVNPCCEISMPSRGFCNLTSINLGTIESQDDFNERAYYASVLGTLQAAYTDFKYIDSRWKKNAEEMALIGVSLTGIAAHPDLTKIDFAAAVGQVKKANEIIAKKIGIKTADRLTTIKPDGTGSLVLGTSSGIHPWHAKHYIRRLRVNKLEPLYNYMVDNFPDLMEDEQMNPEKNGVMSLVIKAPDGAITRRNQTALEFLERIKYMFEHWIKPGHVRGDNYNNVSCTCNVKNHEWDEVREWMWENRGNYTGISLLPYSDSSYIQAPFEDTNEEVYKEFGEKHREFRLDMIEEEKNFVNFGHESACSGGSCEVV
jgi:ribonucleoside-diphosphate reductase alpha chain